MPFPSDTIWCQAAAVEGNACGLAASLGHREQHNRQSDRFVKGGSGHCAYYSYELKRQFCLFKRNWMSMQNDGARSKAWCISRLDFFRSKPQFLEGPIPSERTTRIWWSHRQKYLTDVSGEISTCGEQGRCGGKVGICSEKNDSAGGGWDDCMDDSHRRDAEQGEAEGGAFADTSAADADHDAAPHHVAQVQAQSPSKESQSPVAARAADAAPQPWKLRRIMRVLPLRRLRKVRKRRPQLLRLPQVRCLRGSSLMRLAPRPIRVYGGRCGRMPLGERRADGDGFAPEGGALAHRPSPASGGMRGTG